MESGELRSRFVSAYWGQDIIRYQGSQANFEAFIEIRAENDFMLLANITNLLAELKVSLHQINSRVKNNAIIVDLVVGCRDVGHFNAIMSKLKTIPKVLEVRRGHS